MCVTDGINLGPKSQLWNVCKPVEHNKNKRGDKNRTATIYHH